MQQQKSYEEKQKQRRTVTEMDSPRFHHTHNQDIFDRMLEEQIEMKNEDLKQSKRYRKREKTELTKQQCMKMLNTSSSNQNLIPQLRNDSSMEIQESAQKHFQTENSQEEESFRKSFKKRAQQSFSVEYTEKREDSFEQFSEKSDSRSQNNFIPYYQKFEQEEIRKEDFPLKQPISCNCKRSKCLKLYCECFHMQVFCNQKCKCHSCGNHKNNAEGHQQAIIQALSRNPRAFEQEFELIENPQRNGKNTFSLGVELEQVKRGCKCKKTKCLKKYCECYNKNEQCGIFCKCEDCENRPMIERPKESATIIKLSKFN